MEYITGFHAIEEAVRAGNIRGRLYLSKTGGRHQKIEQEARNAGIRSIRSSDEEIKRLSGTDDHRGIMLAIEERKTSLQNITLKTFLKTLTKEKSLVLLLDGITDPHNYGAILRSADQFGVDLVIIPQSRSAKDSEIIGKTSAGAREFVSVAVENLSRSIDLLKEAGYWVYAADMDGQASFKLNLKGRTAIIMGSEGSGVSKILSEKSDGIISIPAQGHVDSFNVSVAAGILMYEVVRQNSL